MNVINLAHGSLYMIGAYGAALVAARTGSFLLAIPAGLLAGFVAGLLIEFLVIRKLYDRDHLQQVLATFGLMDKLFNTDEDGDALPRLFEFAFGLDPTHSEPSPVTLFPSATELRVDYTPVPERGRFARIHSGLTHCRHAYKKTISRSADNCTQQSVRKHVPETSRKFALGVCLS